MSGLLLNAADYEALTEYIYHKTGIRFEKGKEYYVQKRVEKRLQQLNMSSFQQYFSYLRFQKSEQELEQLINSITVNETYFFREYRQLACFAHEVLPEILAHHPPLLKVWSAGCSTGEEAYTLAIILQEMLEGTGVAFEVWATDINTQALRQAEAGLYGARAVKDVPRIYLQKYFSRRGEEYAVLPALKEKVRFRQINLGDERSMRLMRGFYAIFCRNVLIYFDDLSRRRVALHFYQALEDGGFIFLGHSESMSRITSVFKLRRFSEAIVYQKRG